MIPPITVISGPTKTGKTTLALSIRQDDVLSNKPEPKIIDGDTNRYSHSDLKKLARKQRVIIIIPNYASSMFPFPHQHIAIAIRS